jgi:hypothetical protein
VSLTSNCACIKKYFDLYVSSTDCRHLILEDQSVWMSSTGFSIPQPFVVTVDSLSFSTSHDITVDPSKRNVYTSVDIHGTDNEECISDGIYCFRTESCGVKYSINRAYLCNARCQIDTLISQNSLRLVEDIQQLEFIYKSVEINTKLGKLKVASDMFEVLVTKLQKLGCDKKSCCG